MDPKFNWIVKSPDDIEVAEILVWLKTKPVTDAEAIWIEETRQRQEVSISDDESDTVSSQDTISCQDTISYRSPTPEPISSKATKLLSPPITPTESADSEIGSSQGATSQPLGYNVAKGKRRAEDVNSTTAGPPAKKPRQRAGRNSANKQKAPAAKTPLTTEEKKAARVAKAEEDRQIYQRKDFKPRVRKDLDIELDAMGVPLPAEGVPAELAAVEKKPRAPRTKPNQA
ncbi:uncharacterized protein EAE97_005423 [Botrytis byssoidea]|uniref:Uncharacterized protein n=1 Tax=Botrytis byssoidea TaxID=139641 RepID=A0A9P5M393_9HELO|nr:uncharacterized protein EAE97_005423 [Botrytis byssoidea]KAF7944790.1 hypothetical protein EAE97_005423 [Botrytis byssoidea]